MKTFAIRVATGIKAGGGHVSRCLAVAKVLSENNCPVTFYVDQNSSYEVMGRIKSQGFSLIQEHSTRGTSYLKNYHAVLIDSYGLSKKDIEFWSSIAAKSFIFDDEDKGYSMVDGRIIAKPSIKQNFNNQATLHGINYIAIDQKFKTFSFIRDKNVRAILFTFGLYDSKGLTKEALKCWEKLARSYPDIKSYCIIGSNNPHANSIRKTIDRFGEKAELIVNSKNIAELLVNVDIAVGAAGLSLYERACSGVVNIAIPVSRNQESMSRWLSTIGGCWYIDPEGSKFQSELHNAINDLLNNKKLRETISRNAMYAIDGQGAKRIASKLLD